MTKQNAKRWTHPIALGAVAGFLLGGSYLLLNSSQDEETVSAPVNAAQVENNRLDTSDEKMAMEEEPAPVVSIQASSQTKPTAEVSANAQMQAKTQTQTAATPALQSEQKPQTTTTAATQEPITSTPAQAALPSPEPTKTSIALPEPAAAPMTTQAKSEAAPAAKLDKPTKALSKEEEHLLSVDKKFYTLQLVGARNEKSVKQFIQKNELKDHAYIYRTKLSGKDWYVAVLGEYATMDEAKAAASGIPEHIAAKPWIREFTSIHNDIKKQG